MDNQGLVNMKNILFVGRMIASIVYAADPPPSPPNPTPCMIPEGCKKVTPPPQEPKKCWIPEGCPQPKCNPNDADCKTFQPKPQIHTN